MELREALTQLAEIRLQIARTEVFRGYRAAPVAFSGCLAVSAAIFQSLFIPRPAENLAAYLTLWIGAAALSATTTLVDIWLRHSRSQPSLRNQLTWLACEQFLPCVVAGALVTFVLVQAAPDVLWMLPGLWAILMSQGMFASYRLLPRSIFWVACFYLMAGALNLTFARGDAAFSPWAMGVTFSLGQFTTAAILYDALERHDV